MTTGPGGMTDGELAEAALGGDVESFGELYRRYYAVTVGVARAVLRDGHLAEDAAQEAFAAACRDLGRLRRPERFAAWLRGICQNIARGIRRRRLRGLIADPPDVPVSGDGRQAQVDLVRKAVDRLPAKAREVVLLHYFSGASHERIAAMLGISAQAVHGRLIRARRKIAADLQRGGLGGREP